MASGTINGTVQYNSDKYTYYITWYEESPTSASIAGNYSYVVAKHYWGRKSSYNDFDTAGNRYSEISINGTKTTLYQPYDPASDGFPYLIAMQRTQVAHDADGTKSITISSRANGYASTYGTSSGGTSNAQSSYDCTASATVTLTPILRSSTIGTVSNFVVNTAITVPITKYVSSYTESLSVKIGSTVITTRALTLSVGTANYSLTFTSGELTAIYNAMPTSATSTFTFTLTTMSGSTTIGTSVKTAAGTLQAAIKPSISSVSVSPVNTNAWLISLGTVYAAGNSKCRVQTSATAGTGSTILAYNITGIGTAGTSADFTSDFLTEGAKVITVVVTDARGRTKTATANITVVPYTVPVISTLTYERGTYAGSVWTASMTGDDLKVTMVTTLTMVANGNKATLKVLVDDVEKASQSNAVSGTTYIKYATGVGSTSVFTLTASSQDNISTGSKSVTVPSAAVPMDVLYDGSGISFGKSAETPDLLDVAWDLKVDGDVEVTGNVLKACCATGTAASLALTSGTVTQITLASISVNSDSALYSISSGGIKVAQAGNYIISGSVNIKLTDAANTAIARGVYIFNGATEINNASEYSYNSNNIAASIASGMKIVTLAANDIIYLKARVMGTSGTAYPNNLATYLTIVKI